MQSHPEAQWVRVLRGNYIKDSSLNFSKSKVTNLSTLWSRILDMVKFLPHCTSISIGNGLDTNVWTDTWIAALGPLASILLTPIDDHHASMSVQEFFQSHLCNRETLQTLFPVHVVDIILSMLSPPRGALQMSVFGI